MPEQRIVIFKGTVQGVGFRYTTCRVAGGYDVVGQVRNCPDGSVECIVEGEAAEIDAFIAEVSEAMGRYIRKRTEQTAPASGRFTSFGVGY
ncbi:MAG: acylphosphatase [Planctomycetota bacterium]